MPEPQLKAEGLPAEIHLRQELAAAYRLVDYFGWCDLTNTHISVRIPGSDHHFLLNTFDLMFEEITASSLARIDLHGNVLDAPGKFINKAGFTIHAGIHAARENAKCVIHLHTVAGIAVGAQKEGLLPLSAHAMTLCGRIGYHAYEGVVIDNSEVPRIVSALGSNAALFLRNHGTIAVGENLAEAFYNIYMLERACQIQVAALAGGKELVMQPQSVSDHMQSQMRESFSTLYEVTWNALVRMIDRRSSDFRS